VYTVRAFTVVDNESLAPLIGYAVFFVHRNPHYRSSLQAVEDVIYLDPEYRRGRTASRLVRFAERRLTEDGVQVIYHHAKVAHPALGKILERMGYEHIENIYGKRVK